MTNYNRTITKLSRQLYRNSIQTDRAIRVKKFIDQNFEKPIPLDKIASAVYCSKFHLNREFKRHCGITPLQYLKDKRILEAKKLFSDNSSVTDTCYTVGYDSLSTFSMLFKQWTGSSPSDYKKARMNK